ncbi:MAG: T9SS type A sorting domain-containing protein [bacterium]|nr:T9SS type A sorting domain-containing protein [bacterium]
MKRISSLIAIVLVAYFGLSNFFSRPTEHAIDGMIMNLSARMKAMVKMLADPSTGRIPDNMRALELDFSKGLPVNNALNKFATWESVGPYNVGGRTRALAIDVTDNEVLLAGAATGGIWRSTNAGVTWYATQMQSVPTANITGLVQDKRKGKGKTWYASTGELYGGSIPGAFYNGSGIYKSTNGGDTWVKAGNVSSGLGGLSGAWSVVHRIAVNATIDSIDVVYAANFDGIYRSTNGGTSWIKVRGGNSQAISYSYFTDVAVSAKGIVYATLSGGGQQQGFWRSADNGKTWANITPDSFQTTWGRISIGIAPSDENQVYFVAYTPGIGKESRTFEGKSEFNSLWKYTYASGDGSGSGGLWSDRSANIPVTGVTFGSFISQGGYCLELTVKPDDANVVFLGGTNLYRSLDGFSTKNATSQIGGYGIATTLPDFKVYPNHHPDNHGVIFYPENANRMLSVHDGGISLTQNCLATEVSWESLNHGYVTSQFYSIAQDASSNSNYVVGGLQDNGTYANTNPTALNNWAMPLSYDGSFCHVKPGGGEVYLSIQQGRMHRMLLNSNGVPTQFTRIDPKGVDKSLYQFINPFTPDANNFKVLYTPAGNVIWRNSDVTGIPLKNQLDSNASSINWTRLKHTLLLSASDEITAIYSSKIQADVLFYGTAAGKLYRLRNASDTASMPELINGANFPSAYINCITQHPSDTAKLYVVFTNYYVLSVFETSNSGQTWLAVSGNLEQSSNGAGNGPSCRWLSIAPTLDSLVYFLGTSTGLYATKKIDGMQTSWTRQGATTIGTTPVTMMQHRVTDGRMVVSTYGAGVFMARINSLDPTTGIKPNSKLDFKLYPNPTRETITLSNLPRGTPVNYEIFAMNGQIVLKGIIIEGTQIDVSGIESGAYVIKLKGSLEGNYKTFLKH